VNPRRALALITLVGALAVSAPALAQTQRTFLEVVLNGVPKGDTLVVLREGDALVGAAWLAEAGVTVPPASRVLVENEEVVSLASLAPDVTFTVDERDLRLTVTVSPALLGRLVRDLQQGRPATLVYRRNTSGFVNYALNAGSAGDYDIFSEAGLSAGGALVTSTLSLSRGTVVRGMTSMTLDDRSRIRRWVIGDALAATGTLGGDAVLAGVTVTRDFSVEPYFVRHPTLSLSTPVAAPSVVEVHVNGRLVREERIQPGMLDIRNLPLTTGHNDTRIVIRDPFGGTRELANGYYSTASVLATGVHDYQYSAGVRRASLSNASWTYTAPAALARHRVGLTSILTAGGRIEAAADLVSGGPSVTLRLPFGELEASLAASRSLRGRGTAAAAAYAFSAPRLSAGASMRVLDAGYEALTLTSGSMRPRSELSAFLSLPVGGGISASMQHSYATAQDGSIRTRSEGMMSRRLGRHADLMASAARADEGRGPRIEASVAITIMMGGRTSVTSTVSRTAEGARSAVDLQRPLPMGTGYGYQLRSQPEQNGATSGALQYQGTHGRYEVRYQPSGGRHHASVNVSGALVGIGGGVFATRPVRSSYALVQVPGVKGVRGFSSNQEIGRTNRRGQMFVPDLLPYYANVVNIADTDIPIEYTIPRVQDTVAPPFRGGVLVRFPVQRVQHSEGRILVVIGGVERVPTYGELAVTADGRRYSSPVGAAGEFYFEDLPVGRHEASVDAGGRACAFTLEVPAADAMVARLGTLTCVMGEGR